jgi:hypothetical protein
VGANVVFRFSGANFINLADIITTLENSGKSTGQNDIFTADASRKCDEPK